MFCTTFAAFVQHFKEADFICLHNFCSLFAAFVQQFKLGGPNSSALNQVCVHPVCYDSAWSWPCSKGAQARGGSCGHSIMCAQQCMCVKMCKAQQQVESQDVKDKKKLLFTLEALAASDPFEHNVCI